MTKSEKIHLEINLSRRNVFDMVRFGNINNAVLHSKLFVIAFYKNYFA